MRSGSLLLVLVLVAAAVPAFGEEADLTPSSWLVAGPLPGASRGMMAPDPVAAAYVLAEKNATPKEGDKIAGIASPWRTVAVDGKGWVRDGVLRNGYAYANIRCESGGSLLVEGQGHYYLYMNGQAFPGDVYRRRRGAIAVPCRKGDNALIVRVVRGQFLLGVKKADRRALLTVRDPTLPDVREGLTLDALGAIVVVNASAEPLEGAMIEAGDGGLFEKTSTAVPFIPPHGLFKTPFRIRLKEPLNGEQGDEKGNLDLPVSLCAGRGRHEVNLKVPYRREGQTFVETFVSDIDGSVQYYGVRPPLKKPTGPASLYLSLHGASVEARGQANSYSPKPGGWVVAATNRRPFGFDWEDWGRLDALEVLRAAMRRFPIDPDRVYLCGHSMGGHGTWHLSVTKPGLFAGISPSAGWISFFSYGGARRAGAKGPAAFMARCQGHSDTLTLKRNLRDLPIFIIHGTADDNVPIREARTMVKELGEFHHDFQLREFPGKGHWWDQSKAPGADCVDLSDLFDFFRRHRRDPAPRDLEFYTYNLSTSADHRWVRIERQDRMLERSKIRVLAEPGLKTLHVDVENVSRFSFAPAVHFEPGPIEIISGDNASTVTWDGALRLHLKRTDAGWTAAKPLPVEEKRPGRFGPFKAAFEKRFALVYGTGGSEAENAAALNRARFEASMWWYRGNGACELVPDTRFRLDDFKGRNVILYGHAAMNSAFPLLLKDSPVTITRGALQAGGRRFEGDDIALLLVRPSPLGPDNLVAVVGGTGAKGLLATFRVSYLRSFVQFPDWFAYRWSVVKDPDAGLLGTGLFGHDWSFENGEHWLEPAEEEGF